MLFRSGCCAAHRVEVEHSAPSVPKMRHWPKENKASTARLLALLHHGQDDGVARVKALAVLILFHSERVPCSGVKFGIDKHDDDLHKGIEPAVRNAGNGEQLKGIYGVP